MADQGLVNYIKRSLAAGIQLQEITAVLLQAGWQQSLIDEGFAEIQGLPVPQPTTNGAGVVTMAGSSSVFEKMRRWLLILIGARLILIPVQYFFLSLVVSPGAYGYYSPSLLGQVGLMSVPLPLIWLLPFFGIRRREKSSYIISIFFAIVLIYLNLFGFSALQTSNPLYIFSFIYLITGVLIIILAASSFKYFPKRSEEPNLGISIDESKASMAKILTALLFGITVIVPGFLGLGLAGSIGSRLSRPSYGGGDFFGGGGDVISSVIAAFILGALLGWFIESGLIDRIKRGSSWAGLGAMAGFLGGAIAQLPLYGFSGIQIIAMPVGAVIGVLLGAIGVEILGSITKSVLKS